MYSLKFKWYKIYNEQQSHNQKRLTLSAVELLEISFNSLWISTLILLFLDLLNFSSVCWPSPVVLDEDLAYLHNPSIFHSYTII